MDELLDLAKPSVLRSRGKKASLINDAGKTGCSHEEE